MLDSTMERHRPDALIEVLHAAQAHFGHLAPDVLRHVARGLKLPPSRVQGVATFYHSFSPIPESEHRCAVCMGTACYVKGAARVLATIERQAGLRAGQATPDGRLSLATVKCPGTCGIAPAVFLDGIPWGNQTPESASEHVKGWLEHGPRGTP
jgi:bidirectional [NiFe] hydrogenase diaphorase subunit